MAPMNEEQKSKLLARLKEGRARVKASREEAKAKGLPDPKPRKARKGKTAAGVLKDPEAAPSANDKVAPIDGAPANADNALATFIGLVFTFLLIFSLVPKFGIQGSVLSAILSYSLTSLVAIIIYLCQGGKFVLFPKFSEIQNYLFTKTKVNEKSK